MFGMLITTFFLLGFFNCYINAQTGTISVGPLLTCDLTTFSCPGLSGCCTIGGCCGSGCCANGYSCINEGTADEACCSVNDATKCGTVDPSSGSNDGSGSDSGACIGIDNCPRDPVADLAWTCVLGQKCGLSYPECYPCVPSSGNGGSDNSTGSDDGSGSDNGSDTDSSSDSSTPTSSTIPASNTINPTSSFTSGSPNSSPTSDGNRLVPVNLLALIVLIGAAVGTS